MNPPDELKSWLYNVLKQQYQNINQSYNDILQLLLVHKTLRPRTKVHTSIQGYSDLLVNIYGTIPSKYQSNVYFIPIEIWIPFDYPSSAPYVYVVPTQQMILKISNYIDSNGRFYNPYLIRWVDEQTGDLVGLSSVLSQVFSEEPPVFAKPKNQLTSNQPQQVQQQFSGSSTSSQERFNVQTPPKPPRPPKLPGTYTQHSSLQAQFTGNHNSQSIQRPEFMQAYQQNPPALSGHNYTTVSQQATPPRKYVEEPDIFDAESLKPKIPTNPIRLENIEEAEKRIKYLLSSETTSPLENSEIQPSAPTIRQEMNPILENDIQVLNFEKNLSNNISYLKNYSNQLNNLTSEFKSKISELETFNKELNELKPPPIDDIICGETIVFNQMYDSISEIKAIDDTLHIITDNYNYGQIKLDFVLKYGRNLAREQFLKKQLVENIANELGLKRDAA